MLYLFGLTAGLTRILLFRPAVNVFKGVLNNPLFCCIWIVTSILQALIVQFGSVAFHVSKGGLDAKYWGFSLAFGIGSLPVQQLINLVYRAGQRYNGWRHKRRLKRNNTLSTRSIDGHSRRK